MGKLSQKETEIWFYKETSSNQIHWKEKNQANIRKGTRGHRKQSALLTTEIEMVGGCKGEPTFNTNTLVQHKHQLKLYL